MSDAYLNNILKVITESEYLAQYLTTPIDQRPIEGCVLPDLTPLPGPLTPPTAPADNTCCVPTFIPLPIIPAPFTPPENCPNGITFNTADVNIYAQLSDVINNNPAATVAIGAQQSPNSFCNYDLSIPPIVIPCYPNGPVISSLSAIRTRDPVTNRTTSTQRLTINKSATEACNFVLEGNPVINIPCSENGFNVTLGNVTVVDPFNLATHTLTPSKTSADVCNTSLDLPPINIPCYPDGIKFTDPIRFRLVDFTPAPNGTGVITPTTANIDLTDTGGNRGANGDPSCTWNTSGTVDLPALNCPTGFAVTSSFVVKTGGLTVPTVAHGYSGTLPQYNSIKLTPAASGCGVDLSGILALNIPCPNGISTSSNSNIKLINPNNQTVVADLGLKYQDCTIGFNAPGNIVIPGLLPCTTATAPSTNISFIDATGNPVGTSSSPANNSHVTFSGTSLCDLQLSGVIQFPSSGGGGGSASIGPWDPCSSSYTPTQTVAVVSTEGSTEMYQPNTTSLTSNDVPGASPKWTFIAGSKISPYQVIKTDSPVPNATANSDDDLTQKDTVVKVVPTSYLFKDETSNTRLPVFGLDMPFVLKPNEFVYMEVIHAYFNNSLTPTPLFGAICKGTQYDFDILYQGSSTIAAASDNTLPYKTLTRTDLSRAIGTGSSTIQYNDGTSLANYINAALHNYVGIGTSSALRTDVFKIQAYALQQIADSTAGSSSTPWQFKSFEIIAYAEPVTTAPTLPTSGACPSASRKTSANSLSTGSGGATIYYTFKQNVTKHQVLKMVNNPASSSNIPVMIISDFNNVRTGLLPSVTKFLNSEPSNQPTCTIHGVIDPAHTTYFKTTLSNFTIGGGDTSPLLTALAQKCASSSISFSAIVDSAGNPKVLSIGTGPLDIKVYYAYDSQPSINTAATKSKCVRWEGSSVDRSDLASAPPKFIGWVAVHPEFLIADPASLYYPWP